MDKIMENLLLIIIFGVLNSEIYALRCHSCESQFHNDCVKNLDSLRRSSFHRQCANSDDLCIMAIFTNGELYRGCSSDSLNKTLSLESCDEDFCNGEIFPKDRLQCYQCNGANCVKIEEHRLAPCRVYNRRDECYTDAITKNNVIRGCTSDSNYKRRSVTQTCSTTECNNKYAIRHLTCLECDSDVNDGCKFGGMEEDCVVTSEKICRIDIPLGHPGGCFTMHHGEVVLRGCTDSNLNEALPRQDIKECHESNCNNQCIQPLDCYVCDSANGQSCDVINEKDDKTFRQTCRTGTSSCFECRNFENVTRRGCGDFGIHSTGCYSCWDQNLCNSNTINECYYCSSETDHNCDSFTNSKEIDKIVCNKGCLKTIHNDVILRGCWNETMHCLSTDNCHHCRQDNCNDGLLDAYCKNIEFSSSEEENDCTDMSSPERLDVSN